MKDLSRRMWLLRARSSAFCGECGWGLRHRDPVRAGRLARAHTRDTGHPTRTKSVKVTEYRLAGD